jgi:hypothetical protein
VRAPVLPLLAGVTLTTACGEAVPHEAGVATAEASRVTATTDSSLRSDSITQARRDSSNRAQPGYVIDSVLPVEEEIRRFQASLPRRPTTLEHGAASLDALVSRFAEAVSRNDTTALVRLLVTRSEFGHLVYPSSPYTRAPYRLTPDVAWLQIRAASNKGADRLLARFGGKPMVVASYACSGAVDRQSDNTIRTGCALRLAESPAVARKLFGAVIARHGRYKLLSLANDL